MKVYTSGGVEHLKKAYKDLGGQVAEGYGAVVCRADGYKTAVIKEVNQNDYPYITFPYTEVYTIRHYNKCPGKYQALFD